MADTLVAPENDYSSLLGVEIPRPHRRVCVVIPVYNRIGLLARTLAGVATQTYPRELLSVIVADDGSEEEVSTAVDPVRNDLDITVVRRQHAGYGAGQARNMGAERAEASELLAFFDADCIPDPQAVERHAAWHHLADNLVVIGSRHQVDTTDLPTDRLTTDPMAVRRAAFGSEEPALADWASEDYREVLHRRSARLRHGDEAFRSLVSSNFSVGRELFLSVGGFSDDFHRWGGEDTELGWRLWNEGAFFVDAPRASIYHQLQEDAGPDDWRQESRRANDGIIQSKIPHRFYRSGDGVINESPKVSVVVHSPVDDRLEELADQILSQILRDVEVVLVGESARITRFAERRQADPRFRHASTPGEAVRTSAGEFIALVHGASALDHRLLSRSVAALERRPRSGFVRSAYGIPTTEGTEVYRNDADTDAIDARWSEGLPVFGLTRRRDLMKSIRTGADLATAWKWATANLEEERHGVALVFVPAPIPTGSIPEIFEVPRSLRSMLFSDLKSGGRQALTAPLRAVRAKTTGAPYRATATKPTQAAPVSTERRTEIRYVGWTGRSNMGDEAMLRAIESLFGWSNVHTKGSTADLLMLGGGTLINRGYLRHLRPLDSPRIERVAFGPGVANPDYWGEPKEDPRDWVAFLESCLYVGVRGPKSLEILESWGLKRDFEILGDPALTLRPSEIVDKAEGRIVICPAWSRGLLWGGSDEVVIDAFARLISRLRSDGHDVWVLSAYPDDDRHIIDMMRRADAPDLPYLAAHDDPVSGIDLLASAELVVSERLHGAVLASAAGTVPVMVEYRPKLRDYAESVGLGELVIRTDELGGDSLVDLAVEAYERRNDLLPIMSDRVAELRNRQTAAAERIERALR